MAKPNAFGPSKRGIIGSDIKFSARGSMAKNPNQVVINKDYNLGNSGKKPLNFQNNYRPQISEQQLALEAQENNELLGLDEQRELFLNTYTRNQRMSLRKFDNKDSSDENSDDQITESKNN